MKPARPGLWWRFILARAGTWGEQTQASVIWPGDLDADLSRFGDDRDGKLAVGGLPAAVAAGLSLSPSGFPLFASDTGGYRHGPPTKETFTRWFQHTALTPVMQIGTGSSNVAWEFAGTDFDDEMPRGKAGERGCTGDRDHLRLHVVEHALEILLVAQLPVELLIHLIRVGDGRDGLVRPGVAHARPRIGAVGDSDAEFERAEEPRLDPHGADQGAQRLAVESADAHLHAKALHELRVDLELVALAVIASFASGNYREAGMVAFFMLIGEIIETRTADGARKSIESLVKLTPTKARRIGAGGKEERRNAWDGEKRRRGHGHKRR